MLLNVTIDNDIFNKIKEWKRTKSITIASEVMEDLSNGGLKTTWKEAERMNKYDKIANIITGAAAVAFGGYVTADKVKRVGMNKSGELTNEIIIELEDGRIAKASIHKDFVPEGEFKHFVEYLGQVWRENDKRARKKSGDA